MNFEVARTQMLGQQIRAWEVLDDRVLDVLAASARAIRAEEYRDLAFADVEIPLAHGQTMLAPNIRGPRAAGVCTSSPRTKSRGRHRHRFFDRVPRAISQAA